MTGPDPGRGDGTVRPVDGLRFVVVGAYVADCLVHTPRLPAWGDDLKAHSIRTVPGGKGLNQAVTLARLGARISALGVVGADAVGRDILAALTAEGIDVSTMATHRGAPTPVCLVFTRDGGDNAIVWRVPDELAVTGDAVGRAAEVIAAADAVLVTFETPEPIREAAKIAQDGGALVVLNPAPPPAYPAALADVPWEQVDLLTPNEAEARAILPAGHPARTGPAEELPEALAAALGTPIVCVTLAERGCALYDGTTTRTYPAHPAHVVDTTAAGDAFTAVLAACITAGADHDTAVHHAQAAAALTVGRLGAFDALPTADELRATAAALPNCPF
jgi:ribokinase